MRSATVLVPTIAIFLAPGCSSPGSATSLPTLTDPLREMSTFSIVAFDPANGDLGVAVQSRFFAVGPVVPWAEAGVGAIATQSYANVSYGPRGLELLRGGAPPEEVVRRLAEPDPERARRQVGIVDARGKSANLTGNGCHPWAGAHSGTNYSVQGNILVSEATVTAMEAAFLAARGELGERLVAALEAGERAGGDTRGRQSAALLVVRKGAGYGGTDRYLDLRVDEHARPIPELRRLLEIRLGKDPLSRAQRLTREGGGAGALAVVREAEAAHPEWTDLFFEEARLLFLLGRQEEGRAALTRAVEHAGGAAGDHYRAARILAQARLETPCVEALRRALALNREFAHAIRRDLEAEGGDFSPFAAAIREVVKAGAE